MKIPKRPRDPAQLAKLMVDIARRAAGGGKPTATDVRATKPGAKGGPALQPLSPPPTIGDRQNRSNEQRHRGRRDRVPQPAIAVGWALPHHS